MSSFDMLMSRLQDETRKIPDVGHMQNIYSFINTNGYRMALREVLVERKEMLRTHIDPSVFFTSSCDYRMNDILDANLGCTDIQLSEEEKKDDEIVELEATYCTKMKQLKQKMEKNLRFVDEKCAKHQKKMDETLTEQMNYRPIDQLDIDRARAAVEHTHERIRRETTEVATNSILVMMNHINETRKRRRNFSKEATEVLQTFFESNKYPTEAQKEQLAAECDITLQQVSNWFGNKRIREKRISRHGSDGQPLHPESSGMSVGKQQYLRHSVDSYDETPGAVCSMDRMSF